MLIPNTNVKILIKDKTLEMVSHCGIAYGCLLNVLYAHNTCYSYCYSCCIVVLKDFVIPLTVSINITASQYLNFCFVTLTITYLKNVIRFYNLLLP